MSRASLLGILCRTRLDLTGYCLGLLKYIIMLGKIVSTSAWIMKGATWMVKRGTEGGKDIMQEIYDFHESQTPGNFYRNHADLLISTIGWRVNRYILIPCGVFQVYQDGISHHKGLVATIGAIEVLCFGLFVTYFAPMKKADLIDIFSHEWFKKISAQVGKGYLKWTFFRYLYLYKLAKNFPESCPRTYLVAIRTGLFVQNILRAIG